MQREPHSACWCFYVQLNIQNGNNMNTVLFSSFIGFLVFILFWGLPWLVKNLPAIAGDTLDMGSNPGSQRSPGRANATHSNSLFWKIPWTEEPGGLQSMESQRWILLSTYVHTHTHIHTHTFCLKKHALFLSCLYNIICWIVPQLLNA